MAIIRAKYKGFDGVAGYNSGQDFVLVYKENNFLEAIFRRARIEIWRAKNNSLTTGHLKYSSMNSFLLNWDLIIESNYDFPIPYLDIEENTGFNRN